MKKEIYGCACCTPEFGEIFKGNKKVSELSAMNPSEIASEWRPKLLDR